MSEREIASHTYRKNLSRATNKNCPCKPLKPFKIPSRHNQRVDGSMFDVGLLKHYAAGVALALLFAVVLMFLNSSTKFIYINF